MEVTIRGNEGRIILYSDTHLYSYPPFGFNEDRMLRDATLPNCFLLGDIYDVKNAKKDKVEEAKKARDYMLNAHPKSYVSGNHELTFRSRYIKVTIDQGRNVRKLLITHGDVETWGIERSNEARRNEAGKGFFTRMFKKVVFRIPRPLTFGDSFKERCLEKCKEYGCDTIILGHRHPMRLRVKEYKGINIVIAPRGRSEYKI